MKKLFFLILIPIFCFATIDTTTIKYLAGGADWIIYGDSIAWDGSSASTLYVSTPIKMGDYNDYTIELIGDCDSLQVEYITAALLADFDLKNWRWSVDTTCTGTDSVYVNPWDPAFDVYSKWRFIDLKGYSRTALFFRLKMKEK